MIKWEMKWKWLGYSFLFILGAAILSISLVLAGFDKLKNDLKNNALRNVPIEYIKDIGDGQKISKIHKVPESNILPGKPLYFFKEIRDGVWILLAQKPKDRAEIYLLMADKRMFETIELIKNQRQDDLISKTLENSVYNLEKAKESLLREGRKDIEFFKTDLQINQTGLAYEDILKSISYKSEKTNKTIDELEKWNQKNREDMGKN
jgi:hypothetical protein